MNTYGLKRPFISEHPIQRMQRVYVHDWLSDPFQIVKTLDTLIDEFSKNLVVRNKAIQIIRPAQDNDDYQNFVKLLNFVRQKVVYVKDPVDTEWITNPLNLLKDIGQYGFAMEDCDGHVLLLGALAQSLGIPSKARAVRINGSPEYNHVILAVEIEGNWVNADPCVKLGYTNAYTNWLE